MSQVDLLSDALTRVRNAKNARHELVDLPFSTVIKGVLFVLEEEGYINSYEEFEIKKGVKSIRVSLRYYRGKSAIEEIKRISKPGRRMYSQIRNISRPYNGLGIFVLTTPKGIISDRTARADGVGGEVLCSVF